MKNEGRLNQIDFVESVILKVRKYEQWQKKKRIMFFSGSVIAFITLSTIHLVKPLNSETEFIVDKNDPIINELLNQNEMNYKNDNHYAFNAGKMELCLKYLQCNGG